jgi:hypothetical protein
MDSRNNFETILKKENQNPNAKFGFLLTMPMDYYFYKEIYKKLPNSEFFLYHERKGCFQKTDDSSDFLNSLGVHWRLFDNTNRDPKYRKAFFQPYKAVVMHRKVEILNDKALEEKTKIRILYGPGKDLRDFGSWNRFFDLILTYGTYSDNFLKLWSKTEIIGNPKFDPWFQKILSDEDVQYLKSEIKPKNKTILYLPTYGDLCSIAFLVNAIKAITPKYNILIKVHDITKYFEPQIINLLSSEKRFRIFDGRDDILPLLKIADVVISDNSGAIFDAILADKPLVLIDFLKEDFFSTKMEGAPQRLFGKRRRATSKQSIEQIIKLSEFAPGPVVKQAKDLEKSLILAIKDLPRYKDARAYWRNKIFSFNDGRCAERAAEKITNFIQSPLLPQKTLLSEIIDLEEEERRKIDRKKFQTDFEIITQLINKIRLEPSYIKKIILIAKLLTKL